MLIGKLSDDRVMSCSRLAALFGVSPYSTPNDELRKSIESNTGAPDRGSPSEAADWGNRLENVILKEMAERLDVGVDLHITERVEHPHIPLQGSLDGILAGDGRVIQHNPLRGIYIEDEGRVRLDGPGVAEAKLTRVPATSEAALFRGPLQVQGLMMCSGFKWGAIGTLYQGTELRIYLYEPDPAVVAKLEQDISDFAERVKLFETDGVTDWYPALSSNDAVATYITGEDDLPPIELDGLSNAAALALIEAKEALTALNKLVESSTATVMDQMGIHTKAWIQDGGRRVGEIKWGSTSARKEYVVKARPAARSKTLKIKLFEE